MVGSLGADQPTMLRTESLQTITENILIPLESESEPLWITVNLAQVSHKSSAWRGKSIPGCQYSANFASQLMMILYEIYIN